MKKTFVFTPGPTSVRENVRLKRAEQCTNPDLDLNFYEFYKETCLNIADIIKTKNDVFILNGEGILGLEAACASLTEPGDRVLIIDNGIFGNGFGDFVKIYGGNPIYYSRNNKEEINIKDLRSFLEKDNNFKYATVVHCDTPTGMLNDISKICPLLKEFNILTVVDSVAAMGGEELKVDDWKIDIVLGGSQKVFSAPSGLTIVSISEDAYKIMDNRKNPISSFYCNLTIWRNYYKNKWFPYTMPISDIKAFRVAIENILEEGIDNVITRHKVNADSVRQALQNYGLKLFIDKGRSNTVTAVELPNNIDGDEFVTYIYDKYNLLISSSFGFVKGKIIRIGHMGENSNKEKIIYVFSILEKAFREFGYKSEKSLVTEFLKII